MPPTQGDIDIGFSRMILVSTNDNAFDAIDLTRAQARAVTAGRVLGADPVSIIV
jgi:hypothetical protein